MMSIKKINTTKPSSSYIGEGDNNEFIKKINHRNINFSHDKIYSFRTSLFTEKSKNIIQKMSSSQKKNIKDSIGINEKINPPIKQEPKTSIRIKSGKIYILENKGKTKKDAQNESKNLNKNTANVDRNFNKNKKNNKTYNGKNTIISKSYNTLVNISDNTEKNIIINEVRKPNGSKNKTENKIERAQNNENIQKKNIKIINDIKRCKLFSSIPNDIVNRVRNLKGNFNSQNKSNIIISCLANENTSTRKKLLEQKKQSKLHDNKNKTIYRFQSKNKSKKKVTNKKIVSFKYNINTNTHRELNCLKKKPKHSKMQSFSIFNENYCISRYRLGNCYVKRNDRNKIKNSVSESKKNKNKFLKNVIYRNNIKSLLVKDSFLLSQKK